MAVIRPFRALRPRTDLTSQIAALPYDVYSRQEAYEAVKNDRYSFLRIDRPETQFPEDYDMYAEEVYRKAADMLKDMTETGEFVQDETPCFYVYELTMESRPQTGIVACSSVDDYLTGVIRKHENTRREKEEDRIRHVDACSAQTGPIFLAYRGRKEIDHIVNEIKKEEPDADFIADGEVRHRIWTICDSGIVEEIRKLFAEIPCTYIADGHHRAASAVKVSLMRREENPGFTGEEEFNYFLSVLFPADQLKIMDYNRVLKSMNGLTAEELLQRISEKFEIKETSAVPIRPDRKGKMSLLLNNKWYALQCREEFVSSDPVDGLDVAFLQKEILSPVFGIENPSTDQNIDFVGGIRGLGELERRCREDCVAAFAMFPTGILELFAVADAGSLMPPKSTWFEPKLLSGLFIHKI